MGELVNKKHIKRGNTRGGAQSGLISRLDIRQGKQYHKHLTVLKSQAGVLRRRFIKEGKR